MNGRSFETTLCAIGLPAAIAIAGSPECTLAPNGDFENGLAPWSVTFATTPIGANTYTEAGFGVFDQEELDDLGINVISNQVLQGEALLVAVLASVGGISTSELSAQASIRVSVETEVTDEVLNLRLYGDFEGGGMPGAGYTVDVGLKVDGPNGTITPTVFSYEKPAPSDPCPEPPFAAITEVGVLNPLGVIELDLISTGLFEIGQTVELTITVRVTCETTNACTNENAFGTSQVFIDTLRFCPDTGIPGDINDDDRVDVDDLIILISGWGPCLESICNGDFNLDGVIDVDDLITVLTNWTE